MAGEWRTLRVDEFADVIGGGTLSTKDHDNFNGEIPWITPKDLSGYPYRYISRGERNISEQGLANSNAKLLPTGSVMLSTRAPVGYVAIASNPVTTNQGFHSLLPREGFDSGFIYYLLEANTEYLKSNASGTTFGELAGKVLKLLTFRLPSLPEQRAIAHILGTLDDKIELNRRMCGTLEEMARALFKSWFVDFDPVRAKCRGDRDGGSGQGQAPRRLADLFPARLVASELGEIPEGWEMGTLGDIARHPRSSVQPDAIEPDVPYIALEHMPKRCIALPDWGVAEGLESNKYEFKTGDILFGKLRPYFHKVGVAPVDGVCSTDIVVIAPQEPHWFAFVLGLVSSDEFVEYTNAGSTGTKMPRTSWTDMARYEIVRPPTPIAEAFTDWLRPSVERIIASIHESRTLAALHDALLPKLISGELRVKEAEKFIGRVL